MTSTKNGSFEKLRSLLESQHDFPTDYLFKFIVPLEQQDLVINLFPSGAEVEFKKSSKGTYVSVSCSLNVSSADEVIIIYEKATLIPGLISL